VGWEDRVNDRVLIRQLLSKLEARDQMLLKLYSEDYSWKYIGTIVGLTPQSAKQTCYLLLRQLRQTAKGGKLKGSLEDHRTKHGQ